MPLRSNRQSSGVEDAVRGNVIIWLSDQERSEAWLARKMTDIGCSISRSALWQLLHGDRRITVEELAAFRAVTGLCLDDLTTAS